MTVRRPTGHDNSIRRWLIAAVAIPIACLLAVTGSALARPSSQIALPSDVEVTVPVDHAELPDYADPDNHPDFDDPVGAFFWPITQLFALGDFTEATTDDVYREVLRELTPIIRELNAAIDGPVRDLGAQLQPLAPVMRTACQALQTTLTQYLSVLERAEEFPLDTNTLFFFTFTVAGPVLILCNASQGPSELDPVFVQIDEATRPVIDEINPLLWEIAEGFSALHGAPVFGEEVMERFCGYTHLPADVTTALPAPLRTVPVFGPCQVDPTPEVADAFADAVNSTALLSPVLVDGADELSPAVEVIGPLIRPYCALFTTAFVVVGIVGPAVSPSFAVVLGLPAVAPLFILCAASFEDSPLDPILLELDDALGPALSDFAREFDELGLLGFVEEVQAGLDGVTEEVEPYIQDYTGQSVPASPCPLIRLVGGGPMERNQPPPVNRISLLGALCDGQLEPRQGGLPFG